MLKFNSFRKLSTVVSFLLFIVISFSCQEEETASTMEPEIESARYENCMEGCDAQYLACKASSPPGGDAHCWRAWDECFDKCWKIGM